MPVYQSDEYSAVLERIKREIEQQNIQMGPVLSEKDICTFEESHKIQLPEGYRRFLLEVGDGCDMFGGFDLLPLNANRQSQDYVSPFPFTEYVIEAEEPLSEELWRQIQQGTLELIDIGCGQTFQLIITGPCRGEVWSLCEMGTHPCCQRQDFLGWFERWLTAGDDVDYYAEFPY